MRIPPFADAAGGVGGSSDIGEALSLTLDLSGYQGIIHEGTGYGGPAGEAAGLTTYQRP